MKIAIVGSREFKDMKFAERRIFYIFTREQETSSDTPILISGGAKGIDQLSETVVDLINDKMCYTYKIEKEIFIPDWKIYGSQAGYLRNKQIVDKAEMLVAFWDGKSKGTQNSIDLAIKKGIPVDIYVR